MDDETKQGNMVFEAVARTLVIVHNKDFPSDAEWDAYLEALRGHLLEWDDRRSLVVTEGGAPSRNQRSRMAALVKDSVATTAVVSGASAVRATVGALNLNNPAIRAFAPDDLDGALEHLGLRESERKDILAVLPSLQRRVGWLRTS